MTSKSQTVPTARDTALGRLSRRAGNIRRDSKGAVAVLVALLSPVLVGAAGLGGEVGYWYMKQRTAQNAADVAAHAAVAHKLAGHDTAALRAMADYMVVQADVDLGSTTTAMNTPPASGGYTTDANAVEVILTETVPRLFSAIYMDGPIEITARAVATGQLGGNGCVLALNESMAGAISIDGSGTITLSGCDLVTNSSDSAAVDMAGVNASGSTKCIRSVGQTNLNGNLSLECGAPEENAAAISDPFRFVSEPAVTGACQPPTVKDTTVTPTESHPSGMNSIRFCNGLDMKGTVTLDPGLYIVEGGVLKMNANAMIQGSDVTFYMAAGVQLQTNGTANISLSAPTSGPYAGILFFGDRSSSGVEHIVNGTPGSVFDGAIYAAADQITFAGNAGTSGTGCTQAIGDSVRFSGNGSISISCNATAGPTIKLPAIVRIVE